MTRLAFLSCVVAAITFAGPCFAAEPIWSDDFTTLDRWNLQLVSPTGAARTPAAPCWTVKDHWLQPANLVLRKLDKGMFDVALAKTDAVADCTVRCKVRREPKLRPFGVVLRAKDPANCLVAWITTLETIEIRQRTNGRERTLATAFGYLPAGDGTIEVQADGPKVTVLLNGVKSVACDNALVTSGRCGLIATASTEMNVSSLVGWKPDVCFADFQVWKETPPAIVAAPRIQKTAYLLGVTGDSARVLWETLTPMDGCVTFGTTPDGKKQFIKHDGSTLLHDVTITGLKPGTEYCFTAKSGDLSAGDGSFTTDPGPGVPFRVGVLSDTHHAAFTKSVTSRLLARHPQVAIHCGDCLCHGEEADEWDVNFFQPAAELLRNVPTYVAAGNHDAPGRYWSRRYLPYAKDTDQAARYFTFHYGSAQFIVLTHYDTSLMPGSPQYKWLVEQLNSPAWKSARWRFVYYHQPPYSVHWKEWNGDLNVRTHISPLLAKHGATMVLSGHTHSYERGYLNGVVHIINGCIGDDTWGRNYPFVQLARIVPHYSVMDITDDALTFTAYDMQGGVVDHFTLEHGKPFEVSAVPTVVKGPTDGGVGDQEIVLECPELGEKPVRYRMVLDERRSEDGFWVASKQTFLANQEAKLTVHFPVPGKFTVKCQVLTADGLRPGPWIDAGIVNVRTR
jgi:predicted phosphodiesterase